MTASLLVIAPHADDEILGAGAIMARAANAGARIAVVVATDGAQSDPGRDPAVLVSMRREECRAGLARMLGYVPPLLFLEQPDGGLSSSAIPPQLMTTLEAFVEAAAPDTILVTDPADGHPDHKAAFGLASRLVSAGTGRLLRVMPVSQRVDRLFDPRGYEAFAVEDLADRKRAALACHTSQLDPVAGFSLAPDVCDAFATVEYLRTAYDRDDRADDATPAAHFDALFTRSADPWRYDDEPYERDRFRRTVAALAGRRYRSALELGCANGALTEQLAPLCDRLLATDASNAALGAARARVVDLPNVTLERRAMPHDMPRGTFDLIVASDMLYYLGLDGIVALMAAIEICATPDCRILMASYLGETDTRVTGEMAAEIAIAHLPGWVRTHVERTDRLRIDVMARR
ncbi:bifunctional PIG-L family deacetylase/class I SAM-dependent methyltransferase [Sphingomonas sp. 4RDLI-65]|uniref:bifunctional PIG-L family deacetylase/class I SAM-dependent methyltransferase n=1 Tax=Sphingomonas sp. 4RDLI-65 TaxID=3111641 RepID=UPI003C1B6C37